MSEYDPVSARLIQGGSKLGSPLIIVGQNSVDLSKGGILVVGQGDEAVPITFEQEISWSDPPLGEGHRYYAFPKFRAETKL